MGSPEPYGSVGEPDAEFIDLYLGLLSIETVGRSLLSEADYRAVTDWLAPGQAAIVIASNGDYSFRGSGFVRGGIFDRIQLVQDDKTTLFKDTDYRRLDGFAAQGSPQFKEIGLFRLPEAAKFDPATAVPPRAPGAAPRGADREGLHELLAALRAASRTS